MRIRIRDLVSPGSGIWDRKKSDPESGINIIFPDPQHWCQVNPSEADLIVCWSLTAESSVSYCSLVGRLNFVSNSPDQCGVSNIYNAALAGDKLNYKCPCVVNLAWHYEITQKITKWGHFKGSKWSLAQNQDLSRGPRLFCPLALLSP